MAHRILTSATIYPVPSIPRMLFLIQTKPSKKWEYYPRFRVQEPQESQQLSWTFKLCFSSLQSSLADSYSALKPPRNLRKKSFVKTSGLSLSNSDSLTPVPSPSS